MPLSFELPDGKYRKDESEECEYAAAGFGGGVPAVVNSPIAPINQAREKI